MFSIGISRFPSLWKALADTFDPSIPRPSALEPYNPAPFFAEAPLVQEIGWVLDEDAMEIGKQHHEQRLSLEVSMIKNMCDDFQCVVLDPECPEGSWVGMFFIF